MPINVLSAEHYERSERRIGRPNTVEELQVRSIAKALKVEDVVAIETAAVKMAECIENPLEVVLVPVPSSKGTTKSNLLLAEAIARHAKGVTTLDVLTRRSPLESSYALRHKNMHGNSAEVQRGSLMFKPGTSSADFGERKVYLVDNVVCSGATAEGIRRFIGLNTLWHLVYARADPLPGEEKFI